MRLHPLREGRVSIAHAFGDHAGTRGGHHLDYFLLFDGKIGWYGMVEERASVLSFQLTATPAFSNNNRYN
jgi:hypothetical protein